MQEEEEEEDLTMNAFWLFLCLEEEDFDGEQRRRRTIFYEQVRLLFLLHQFGDLDRLDLRRFCDDRRWRKMEKTC